MTEPTRGERVALWEPLRLKAVAARSRAHAPYSGFAVGAALEGVSGAIFTGCNVENASLGGTICAERGALVTAVAAGETRFRRLIVVTGGSEPVAPCGICRQALAEFGMDLEVRSVSEDGEAAWRLSELLPIPFRGDRIGMVNGMTEEETEEA